MTFHYNIITREFSDAPRKIAMILKNSAAVARLESNVNYELFLDATFATSPVGFYQVLTVGTILNGTLNLLYCAPMQSKDMELYDAALARIAQEIPTISIKVSHTDYEMGLMAAAAKSWPAAKVIGCDFHYQNALYDRLEKLGNIFERSIATSLHAFQEQKL